MINNYDTTLRISFCTVAWSSLERKERQERKRTAKKIRGRNQLAKLQAEPCTTLDVTTWTTVPQPLSRVPWHSGTACSAVALHSGSLSRVPFQSATAQSRLNVTSNFHTFDTLKSMSRYQDNAEAEEQCCATLRSFDKNADKKVELGAQGGIEGRCATLTKMPKLRSRSASNSATLSPSFLFPSFAFAFLPPRAFLPPPCA